MTAPRKLVLPAPAKLNLFLYVNGRRPDGYHELQTLFCFLDHSDIITLEARDDDKITVSPEIEGVRTEDNLMYRAAMLLRERTGTSKGASIAIRKILPMGGGLGGGSSDAATVLRGLNVIRETGLTADELADLGRELGADVPVFVRGHAAFAEGVGEVLTETNLKRGTAVVIVPDVHVSTKEVFTSPDLPRNTPKRPFSELKKQAWSNDCEPLVCRMYPEVDKCLSWLIKWGPSRMTGTGACVFSVFDDAERAEMVMRRMPAGWRRFAAPVLSVSPLVRSLENQSGTEA